MMMDFTPTAETISLHGLGFIQVKLPANRRLHVWHPDLPRRACYEHSAVHNHRFSFRSTVLVGEQVNCRWNVEIAHPDDDAEHRLISHNGPRSDKGGRLSREVAHCHLHRLGVEHYREGESYVMPELAYHDTPNDGIVVTLMEKLTEGTVHASTVIHRYAKFDQDFDRFQLPPERLWQFVVDALGSAA